MTIEVPANVLGPREAGPSRFLILFVSSVQPPGFVSHRDTLEGQMMLLESLRALVCIDKTFLNESIGDGVATLGGYNLVARRDRNDGRSVGDILCFAAASISAQVALCKHSAEYERSWLTIPREIRQKLLGVWYRPPVRGEVGSIIACEAEWRRLASDHVATIMVGNITVHHS